MKSLLTRLLLLLICTSDGWLSFDVYKDVAGSVPCCLMFVLASYRDMRSFVDAYSYV